MATDVGIQWVGAEQLPPDLDRLGVRLEHDGVQAIGRVAGQLVPQIRSRMPKLTGALAGSVASSVDGDTVNVTADVVYAGWIEFGGTRGRPYLPAGRYLTPTVAAAANQVGRMVTQQTSQTIGGFGWSHTS